MERIFEFIKGFIWSKKMIKLLLFIFFIISLPLITYNSISHFKNASILPILKPYYSDLGFSKHLMNFKNVLSSKMIPKRKLISDNDKYEIPDTDNLLYNYQFYNNISDYIYQGNWTSIDKLELVSDFENYFFGKITIRFFRKLKKNANLSPKIFQNKSIKASFHLYDERYLDRWYNFNVSLNLPINNESLYININENIIDYNYGENFEKIYEGKLNFSLKAEFSNEEKHIVQDFGKIKTIEYPILKGKMRFNHSFVNFDTEINDDSYLTKKAWNYSIIVSFIGLIEIYYTIQILYEVVDYSNLGTKISLISLAMNIIWNSIVCTLNFFLSINFENFPYQFGVPSLVYFLLFSIFELRLLFYVWKSRYEHIYLTDQNLFRSKLMRFYFFFYASLFISMMLLKQIFSNFIIFYIVFSSTWVPQIILNFKTGAKDGLNFQYILIVSLGKLFIPLYLKSCPHNFLELRPIYFKMILVTLTIILEIVILYMQKTFGPKCLLPAFMKKLSYQYYIEKKDIDQNICNSECIICLEELLKINDTKGLTLDPINGNNTGNTLVKVKMNCIDYLVTKREQLILYFKNINATKPFMITPCNHVFHSKCLELWIEKKKECPFCRRQIPGLE